MTPATPAVIAGIAFALLGSLPPTRDAAAQRLSLRPQIGVYIPTDNLVELGQTGTVGKLEAGLSFGGAIGLGFGSRFGIEVTGTYVPTTFTISGAGPPQEQDARLFLGNALAVFYLLPASGPVSLYLSGGAGVVSRGGIAFTSEAETSDVTGVLGAGAGISLGGLTLVAGADLFRYTATYTGNQSTASEAKQLDIQIRVGFGFPLGGR